jgi:hypothetical protein
MSKHFTFLRFVIGAIALAAVFFFIHACASNDKATSSVASVQQGSDNSAVLALLQPTDFKDRAGRQMSVLTFPQHQTDLDWSQTYIPETILRAASYYALFTGDPEITCSELFNSQFWPYRGVGFLQAASSDLCIGPCDFSALLSSEDLREVGSPLWQLHCRQETLSTFYREYYYFRPYEHHYTEPDHVRLPSALAKNGSFWMNPLTGTPFEEGTAMGNYILRGFGDYMASEDLRLTKYEIHGELLPYLITRKTEPWVKDILRYRKMMLDMEGMEPEPNQETYVIKASPMTEEDMAKHEAMNVSKTASVDPTWCCHFNCSDPVPLPTNHCMQTPLTCPCPCPPPGGPSATTITITWSWSCGGSVRNYTFIGWGPCIDPHDLRINCGSTGNIYYEPSGSPCTATIKSITQEPHCEPVTAQTKEGPLPDVDDPSTWDCGAFDLRMDEINAPASRVYRGALPCSCPSC